MKSAVRSQRLETEHDNLRAALEWGLARDNVAVTGLRFSRALDNFWELSGHLREAQHYLTDVLPRAASLGPTKEHAAEVTWWAQ